jgi:hypothetical protein
MLKSICTGENKIIIENQSLVKDTLSRIDMNKLTDPLLDKEFNLLSYEFGRFFDRITNACAYFANIIKVKT